MTSMLQRRLCNALVRMKPQSLDVTVRLVHARFGRQSPSLWSRQLCTKPQHFGTGPPKEEEKEGTDAARSKRKEGQTNRFADMMEKYGPVFLVHWTGLWAFTGVSLYVGMKTCIPPAQIIATVESWGITMPEAWVPYGTLAAAIVTNEAIEPLRFPVAIATTPMVAPVLDPLVRPFADYIKKRYQRTLSSMEETQKNLAEKLEKELEAQKQFKAAKDGKTHEDEDMAARVARFEKEFEAQKAASAAATAANITEVEKLSIERRRSLEAERVMVPKE